MSLVKNNFFPVTPPNFMKYQTPNSGRYERRPATGAMRLASETTPALLESLNFTAKNFGGERRVEARV